MKKRKANPAKKSVVTLAAPVEKLATPAQSTRRPLTRPHSSGRALITPSAIPAANSSMPASDSIPVYGADSMTILPAGTRTSWPLNTPKHHQFS